MVRLLTNRLAAVETMVGVFPTSVTDHFCLALIIPGDVKLTNLRLKKDALDKFNLPVDVTEG